MGAVCDDGGPPRILGEMGRVDSWVPWRVSSDVSVGGCPAPGVAELWRTSRLRPTRPTCLCFPKIGSLPGAFCFLCGSPIFDVGRLRLTPVCIAFDGTEARKPT